MSFADSVTSWHDLIAQVEAKIGRPISHDQATKILLKVCDELGVTADTFVSRAIEIGERFGHVLHSELAKD